jgi:hypothetical protein
MILSSLSADFAEMDHPESVHSHVTDSPQGSSHSDDMRKLAYIILYPSKIATELSAHGNYFLKQPENIGLQQE